MLSDCNILFIDARGHGKSEGSVLKNMWGYGKHEYKDIIAAIKFAHKKNDVPIILYGVCAGAFNSMHALLKLQKKNRLA